MMAGAESRQDSVHGFVEREPLDFDEEVDGVPGQIALGPAPIAVFDGESAVGGDGKISGLALDEGETVFFQERSQLHFSGGADLFFGPGLGGAGAIRRARCHSLSSMTALAVEGGTSTAIGGVGTYYTADNGPGRSRDMFMGTTAGAVDTVTRNRGGMWGQVTGVFNSLSDALAVVRSSDARFAADRQILSDAQEQARETLDSDYDAAKTKCAELLK